MVNHNLKIERVKIDGYWSLDHKFNNGLNAVITANKHGKSSLLKLIFRALGFNDKRTNELKNNCSKVLLELCINDKKKVIQMITKENNTKLSISNDKDIDDVEDDDFQSISISKLQEIIETELGLIPYNYRFPLEKKDKLNNLGQAYRAFYLMQNHEHEIICNFKAQDVRRNIIQSWLRNPTQSNQFEDKDIDFSVKIKEKKKDISLSKRNIKKRIRQLENSSKIYNLNNQSDEIDYQNIESLELMHEDTINSINLNHNKKKKFQKILEKYYDQVKSDSQLKEIEIEIEKLDKSIDAIKEEKIKMELKFQNKNRKCEKQNEYLIEIKNRLDIRDYKIPLQIFNPSTACDRCGRDLPNERNSWEKEDPPRCTLCGRKRDENLIKHDLLKKRVGDVEEKIADLKKELDTFNQNINEKNSKIQLLKSKIQKKYEEKENKRQDLIKEKVAEIFRNLEQEDNALGKLIERRNIIKEIIDDSKSIPKDKDDIKVLKKEKKGYEHEINISKRIETDWLAFIKEFMIEVLLEDEQPREIELEYSTYLPIIDNRTWRNLVPNEKQMFNYAMYYAFLKCSLIHDIKFPRILIWDCWRTGELDEWKSKRIGNMFQKLSQEFDDEFQMIICTADNLIKDYVPQENILCREDSDEIEEYLFLVNGVITHSRKERE